jgi:hypothetical protein
VALRRYAGRTRPLAVRHTAVSGDTSGTVERLRGRFRRSSASGQ